MSDIEDCFGFMDRLKELMIDSENTLCGSMINEFKKKYFEVLENIARLSKEMKLFEKLKDILSNSEEK